MPCASRKRHHCVGEHQLHSSRHPSDLFVQAQQFSTNLVQLTSPGLDVMAPKSSPASSSWNPLPAGFVVSEIFDMEASASDNSESSDDMADADEMGNLAGLINDDVEEGGHYGRPPASAARCLIDDDEDNLELKVVRKRCRGKGPASRLTTVVVEKKRKA
eukprot:2470173-Amphidinium_carterae.1